MAFYLVLLAVAVVLYLLDRPALTTGVFAGSIVAAVVASYSSFQGLLIWPVGLILLYCRRRSRQAVIVWVGSAILTSIVFFYHYSSSAGGDNNAYGFVHPVAAVEFYFTLIGEATGQQQIASLVHSNASLGHNTAVLSLGIVIVALAIWTLCVYGFRQTESGVPLGVALISFGLLFAAITTVGRVSESLWAAWVLGTQPSTSSYRLVVTWSSSSGHRGGRGGEWSSGASRSSSASSPLYW